MPAWVNLANFFTLLRLGMTPWVVQTILEGHHARALAIFFAAALTDVVDGALARGGSGTTQAGAYLDPIADKCLMSGVFLALGAGGTAPWWFVGIVLGRDIYILVAVLGVMGLTKVRRFPPSRWGKISTFVQIATAITWMTRNAWPGAALEAISAVMLWVCAVFTVWSGLHYTWRGIQLVRAR